MPGIMDIYVEHAESHIGKHQANRTTKNISRAQVELEILRGLDEESFPIEMKLSWYHAILSTSLFDSIWRGAAIRLHLSDVNTTRYIPDDSQQEFKLPSGMSAQIPETSRSSKKARKDRHQSSEKTDSMRDYSPKPTLLPSPPIIARVASSPSTSSNASTTTTATPSPSQITPYTSHFLSNLNFASPRPRGGDGSGSGYGVPRRTIGHEASPSVSASASAQSENKNKDKYNDGNGNASRSDGKAQAQKSSRRSSAKGSAKYVKGSATAAAAAAVAGSKRKRTRFAEVADAMAE